MHTLIPDNVAFFSATSGKHETTIPKPLPKGFGFGDMAFRVFILMASRRLKSDHFIGGQFNKEMYTPEGLVQNTTMKDVLGRYVSRPSGQ